MPCLRRSRAPLYRARSGRRYSDPISAPARIKVGAAASCFAMALRGGTASSLTACPPLPVVPSRVRCSRRGAGRPAVASLSVLMLRVRRRSRSQMRLKESDEPPGCTQAARSVPYLAGKPKITSLVGHCHLGARLSCRHVRLETLFWGAGSVCVISIVAIAPSLRSGRAAH